MECDSEEEQYEPSTDTDSEINHGKIGEYDENAEESDDDAAVHQLPYQEKPRPA